MEEETLKKLSKIAEVSHLNFLFGAGISDPFIEPLPKIEKEMNEADETNDVSRSIKLRRKFFSGVLRPCLDIKKYDGSGTEKSMPLDDTYRNYASFVTEVTKYLLSRKSTLLDKQVNLFTTNIDIFFEKVLEDLGANYNDGFTGHMKPSFRTGNFQTILKKKSEQLGQQSEVPTFNLYKLHGSVTWEYDPAAKRIFYSDLSNLDGVDKLEDKEFDNEYTKLQIVNPNQKKIATSVLDSTYYELLRLFATELEREHSLLLVNGFSFGDNHILDVTRRAMDSNPTLTACILSHTQKGAEGYSEKFQGVRYVNNLHVITAPDDEKIDFKWMVDELVKKLDPSNSYGKED